MIRARTRHTRRRLDHVQPVHLATFAIDFRVLIELAAAVELFHVANMARTTGKEIGIEREDDLGLLRAVNGVDVIAKSELRAPARPVTDGRLPLVPLGLRIK